MSSDWTLLCLFYKEYPKLTIFRVQTSIFQSTGKDKMAMVALIVGAGLKRDPKPEGEARSSYC
jgi:hypothetical protein